MTEFSPVDADQVTVQTQVDELNKAVAKIRAELEAEREGGPPQEAELVAELVATQAKQAALQQQIAVAKEAVKAIKAQIEEMWRTVETHQNEIGALIEQEVAMTGEVSRVERQLAALKAGVYEKPIDEDPRLLSVIAARDSAVSALAQSPDADGGG